MLITILISFIAGFAFCQWIYPSLDGITGIILQKCEEIKSKMALKTTEYSVKATKLAKDIEEQNPVSAIGFVIPSEEEEDYDDD